jgi:hypothetical protein
LRFFGLGEKKEKTQEFFSFSQVVFLPIINFFDDNVPKRQVAHCGAI